jgi:hypothetical protein
MTSRKRSIRLPVGLVGFHSSNPRQNYGGGITRAHQEASPIAFKDPEYGEAIVCFQPHSEPLDYLFHR